MRKCGQVSKYHICRLGVGQHMNRYLNMQFQVRSNRFDWFIPIQFEFKPIQFEPLVQTDSI